MKYLCAILILLTACVVSAQKTSYHVKTKNAVFYSGPSDTTKAIRTLKQYDNVKLLESANKWYKVLYGAKEGYLPKDSLGLGNAETVVIKVRTGAKCKDGYISDATGKGACSNHGGVETWLYNERESVRIKLD